MAGVKRRDLAERDRRLGAATLGDLEIQGVDVFCWCNRCGHNSTFCWCNRCGHNSTLATGRLVAELGRVHPVPEVGARLRCSRCAGKDVATRPAWPSLGQVARHG